MSILTKNFLTACLLLTTTAPLNGGEIDLKANAAQGQQHSVKVQLRVSGKLKFRGKDAIERQPLKVKGLLQYLERTDSVPQKGRVFSAQVEKQLPLRTTRKYQTADLSIAVGESQSKPKLREQNQVVVTELASSGLQIFSPTDPLTRPELDLLDIQAPSSALNEILPTSPVGKGQKWKPVENVLAILLRIDAINKSSVEAWIEESSKTHHNIRLRGAVAGAVNGVSTDIDVDGLAQFDRQTKTISGLTLHLKEDRAIGHASPGLEVEADISLAIQPVASANVPATDWSKLQNSARLLRFSTRTGVSLLHDQKWHVMVNGPKLAVMRMINKGDLIAQCNLSPLPTLPADKDLSIDGLQRNIKANLDKAFGQFLEASEMTTDSDLRVLRVVASGQVSDLPITWIYCVISHPDGRRASLVFTMESKLQERFGAADQLFISALQFVPEKPPTTARAGGTIRK